MRVCLISKFPGCLITIRIHKFNETVLPRRRNESHPVPSSSPRSLPPSTSSSSSLFQLGYSKQLQAAGRPQLSPGCFSGCTPVLAPEPLGTWRTDVVLSVQLRLTALPTGTSCGVQVQAMGCASATLWQGQLHGSPQARLTHRSEKIPPFLPPSFLFFGGNISRVLAPWKDGLTFPSPCQSLPSSSSPSALLFPSLKILGEIGKLLAYFGTFPTTSMPKR